MVVSRYDSEFMLLTSKWHFCIPNGIDFLEIKEIHTTQPNKMKKKDSTCSPSFFDSKISLYDDVFKFSPNQYGLVLGHHRRVLGVKNFIASGILSS